jgi:hypothetical protein
MASEHGQRKIAAILVADVVGYSRLAGADEDRTLSRLRGLRSDLIDPPIAAHHGRIVKRTGDGSLIEFRSVVDAVRCATSEPPSPDIDKDFLNLSFSLQTLGGRRRLRSARHLVCCRRLVRREEGNADVAPLYVDVIARRYD